MNAQMAISYFINFQIIFKNTIKHSYKNKINYNPIPVFYIDVDFHITLTTLSVILHHFSMT